ncbi:MAG: DUF2786 domain-containing protein [Magnetospirillum sp.]|nr:DUF2786 domain-containing protein [Magnetospirillum sp.]
MDVQKLAKVLALAASDNETEAVHALRMARRLLETHGFDFVELSRRVAEGGSGADDVLKDAIFDLRNEIRTLKCENERLKQGRSPASTAFEPVSFHEAARDAAAAIRLRAEIDGLADALAVERAENLRLKTQEATLWQALQEAQAEACGMGTRLSEANTRRMRLEVENRRLVHANHALGIELEEARAERARAAVDMVVHQDFSGKKLKGGPRAKAKAMASQYALF